MVGLGAEIKQYSVIGDKSTVESNANIESGIIWNNNQIGESVTVIDSTICNKTNVKTDIRSTEVETNAFVMPEQQMVTA